MALTTTCYRHPDRVTGASCTRCGRPICAECMTVAPVGHHCPECIREAKRTVRQVRVAPDAVVVKALIAVNVLVYGLQQAGSGRNAITTRFAMQPLAVAVNGEVYRMITSAFLHASIAHLLFNMLALWIVGPALEAALGRVRFLTLYLVSAFTGSVCSYFLTNKLVFGLGASGAVMGLFRAHFVVGRSRRTDSRAVVALLVITIVYGFLTPGIDNWAHIGGVIGGVAMALVFTATEKLDRPVKVSFQAAGTALVIFVAVALTSVRTSQLRSAFP